ncbi:carboxypeptidase regulatory-like domain-containing protein [Candidatus Margulisiibacteriota bacterium]
MANSLSKLLKIIPLFLCFALVNFLSGCGDLTSELSSLTVSPSSATVGINQSQLFTVVARDSLGFIITVEPAWSVSGGGGSISPSGLFTAGGSTGSGTVTATYGQTSATASVTITDKCWVVGRVTGERDPAGVVDIVVSLDGPSLDDRTDSGGYYSISGITAGTHWVYTQTDHQIYQSASTEVTISAGQTSTTNFFLIVREGLPDVPTTTFPELTL